MKNATLFAFAAGLLVLLSAGCKSTPPRTSPLPSATGPGENSDKTASRPPDINAAPLGARTPPGSSGVTGAPVDSNLPDDAKLEGREQDRARFAAETVYFDFDHANVKQTEAGKIERVATAFKSLPPGHDLLIEGHCDERGTEGYNQALGERRALSARELLMKAGIESDHLFTKSLGKDHPADAGHAETAWSKNRRSEFILVLPKKISTTQKTQ